MVQRKVPSKLCVQTEHIKSENQLRKLRPPSPRHQDAKSRGTEMKKKLKKSRSMKRSDFDSCLKSPPFIKEVPQPGKPPPDKQKQSPNYMKSTSSFEARKEQSQVTSQASVDSKTPIRNPKNSNVNLNSGHKPTKTLTRTSSLKLVRTLTKTPSFKVKPVRATTKNHSQVVLCENLNAQRATCSSTLKGSKFPSYLELSRGATESEGTSLMKVCPYTYCSLNGHRHAPLPPLKCFLSARRRALKTQKSMKLGCLSPRRTKLACDLEKEIFGEMTLDEKAAIQEQDLNGNDPLLQEDHMDFYIDIYVKNTEDTSKTNSDCKGNDGNNEAPSSEVDLEINLDCSNVILMKMNASEFLPEEDKIQESAEEDDSPNTNQEEENPSDMELNGTDSETSDMALEEDQRTILFIDDEVGNSDENKNEPDLKISSSFKEQYILSSSYFDEIPAEKGLEEFFEEEVGSPEENCIDSGFDSEGSYYNFRNDKATQEFSNQTHDLVSPIPEVHKEPLAVGNNGNSDSDDENKVLQEEKGNPRADTQSADDKSESISSNEDEALIYHQENVSLDHKEASAFHDCDEPDQDEVQVDYQTIENNKEPYQPDYLEELLIVDAGAAMEEIKQDDATKSPIDIQTSDLLENLSDVDQDMIMEDKNEVQLGPTSVHEESNKGSPDDLCLYEETHIHSPEEKSKSKNIVEDQIDSDKDTHQAQSFKLSNSVDSEDQAHSGLGEVCTLDKTDADINAMEVGCSDISDPKESFPSDKDETRKQTKTGFIHGGGHSNEELQNNSINLRITKRERSEEELEEEREFNPHEPNYLPVKPDPEAEKVDLKHQDVDERKNAEEWMLDYALQQTVTKLAPARKRKVALLVEAFEKVMPPKYESHLRNPSPVFAHARPIQACS